jgi:4-amino-4-deoxy-L-arabinose transferase-like glycosyltransferase
MRRLVSVGLLLVAFLALRLPSLRLLPLYSDEALGLWRAERVLEGSLTRGAGEGKPLHAWMIAAAIALPFDPIVSARVAHVLAGALLMVVLWDLATRRLGSAIGWTAAALWVVLPFPALFERTVTPDVPLAAAGVAVVACALRVASPEGADGRVWRWLLLVAGAAAMFFKMPVGALLAATPLLVPLTLPPEARSAARARLRLYSIALGGTVVALTGVVVARMALGRRPLGFGVHEFGRKIAVLREADRAADDAMENLRNIGEYARLYLGPLGTLLVLGAVVGVWFSGDRLVRMSVAFALAWTTLFAATARSLSAHYLLATLPFYVVGRAWVLVETANANDRRIGRFIVVAVLVTILGTSWPLRRALWSDPPRAKLASPERSHYIEGDWSGYGLPDAVRWIERELATAQGDGASRGEPVFVAVHLADYERLRLYAIESARGSIKQVQVDRYTLRVPIMIERARAMGADGRRVFLVVGSERRFTRRWRQAFPRAVVRAVFPRPRGTHAVVIWELEPAGPGTPSR